MRLGVVVFEARTVEPGSCLGSLFYRPFLDGDMNPNFAIDPNATKNPEIAPGFSLHQFVEFMPNLRDDLRQIRGTEHLKFRYTNFGNCCNDMISAILFPAISVGVTWFGDSA
jgi:hypothetical protein